MQGFISYAHSDATAFETLREQLRALEDAFTTPITLWADDDLHAGQNWEAAIRQQVAATDLFILLLSPAFLASRFIRDTEIPAIQARLRTGRPALICPVLLQSCGYQARFGRLQIVPQMNRQLLAIDAWPRPADGFDAARAQLETAIRTHFKLAPAVTDWLTPLETVAQDPAGPMSVERDNQLALDKAGGEADAQSVEDAVVQQLYQPNHDKAVDLARQVAGRDNDFRGTAWAPLVAATADLAAVLNQPLDRLPDHITTLWECSVRVASLLLMDKQVREHPELGTPPLDVPLHRALDDLVGSVAPFVRAFATGRALDDARGRFLLSPQLLEPARRFVDRAEQAGVVTVELGKAIRESLDPRLPDNEQAMKLIEYGYRGVSNLKARIGVLSAHYLRAADSPGGARPSPLIQQTGTLLSESAADLRALTQDDPADLRIAWGHLPMALSVSLAGGVVPAPPSPEPDPAAVPPPPSRDPAFWPGSAVPAWAADWGTDRCGRWVSFAVPDADGKVVSQRMRWIPPGHFVMGSPVGEAGRDSDEGPQTPIQIPAGFWMFDTPCTQALWQAIRGDNPSGFQSPDRPVERVSFPQARDFIKRLNQRLPGLALSLPSEAQWEYACRAGTTEATYVGDLTILGNNNAPVLDSIAWYGGNSGRGFDLPNGFDLSGLMDRQYPNTRSGTHPVARKAPNLWGLHDVLGNVWEWCADAWHATHDGADVDGAARIAGRGAAARVVRGGSWNRGARSERAACRGHRDPASQDFNLGFRCARVHEQSGRSAGTSNPSERSETAATTSPKRRR